MENLWRTIPKPILALAPMEDVTDTVFRQIIASTARPDVFFTEFTSVEGMQSEGREAVIHRLKFSESERSIIAQIWGVKPENYYKTAKELAGMGFDGIDINMGCPIRDIVKNGACSALIGSPALAGEIVMATKEGAGTLPVSVKTRIGIKNIKTEQWVSYLLSLGIDALIVHGRTAAELSRVPVHWDEVTKAVKVRNDMDVPTVVLGNGDVKNAKEATEKAKMFGLDGIMMGRAVFDNPWVFDRSKNPHESTTRDLLELMKKHVELFEDTWADTKHFAILKKFFKVYIKGFDGASDFRVRAMETRTPKEVYPIIDEMFGMLQ